MALLEKHRISHIDFMSLDLEGFELPALRGLDFSRVRPTWLLIEERQPELLFAFLSPWYLFIKKLSDHDYLFRAKA
jgi:hypothetical protein